jgi:hypothetical protein
VNLAAAVAEPEMQDDNGLRRVLQTAARCAAGRGAVPRLCRFGTALRSLPARFRVGETPNLAARLQALAQPNQIVVSAATRAMLGDHFDLKDLGAYELKGFAEPVPVWRVLSARDVESRFAATRTGSAAPLVGRQEEMGLLLRPGTAVAAAAAAAKWFAADSSLEGALREKSIPARIHQHLNENDTVQGMVRNSPV